MFHLMAIGNIHRGMIGRVLALPDMNQPDQVVRTVIHMKDGNTAAIPKIFLAVRVHGLNGIGNIMIAAPADLADLPNMAVGITVRGHQHAVQVGM